MKITIKRALGWTVLSAFMAFPLTGWSVTVNGALTASSPRFDRDATAAPCDPPLSPDYAYNTYPIHHAGGTLTIEMKGESSSSGTLSDPYIYLYGAPFDPSSPCTNFVDRNDDGGTDLDALLSDTYPAGNYVIVATSYDEWDNTGEGGETWGLGTYQLTHNGTPMGPAVVASVPTMSEWGLLLLGGLLAGGMWLRRRRIG